jgi:hypothetical protein
MENQKSALRYFRPKVPEIQQPSEYGEHSSALRSGNGFRLLKEIHTSIAYFTDILQVTFVEKTMKLSAIHCTWKC